MIESVAIATDGSESVRRCVDVALDLAERFDAEVHALYVVDEPEVASSPERLREDFRAALEAEAEDALAAVADRTDRQVTTVVERGRPADVVCEYARREGIDVIATGTRGRHGEHRFLVGSVAERVVRTSPVPVLTVRQLEAAE